VKNILITGCAGFIGSHAVDCFLKNEDYFVVGYDLLTYAGKKRNLKNAIKSKNFKFVKGDICNTNLIKKVCNEYNIQWIINFAAETHVDNSIKNVDSFIHSNIKGVASILNVCKDYKINLLHISTDEIYGSRKNGSFEESDIFDPRNPYSATKAASEHLVNSYVNTHDINAIIVRPSNNFGPRQHAEKFLPTILRSLKANKKVPIYGKGNQVREWLYVKDNVAAVKHIMQYGKFGEVYNITSNNEMENIYLVKKVCKILNKEFSKSVEFVKDRPGHDFRYSITNKKLINSGFNLFSSFESSLNETLKEGE
jgi:dTDP-glucose 4,6-dehydratase